MPLSHLVFACGEFFDGSAFKQWEDVGKWIEAATIPDRIPHPIPGGAAGVSILSNQGETNIVPTPPPAENKPPALKTKGLLST